MCSVSSDASLRTHHAPLHTGTRIRAFEAVALQRQAKARAVWQINETILAKKEAPIDGKSRKTR